MALSKEQSQFYQQTLDMTRKQIDDLNTPDRGGAGEGQGAPGRAAERSKNAAKQIYDGACKILGIENDLEKEDESGRLRRVAVAWFRREHTSLPRGRAGEPRPRGALRQVRLLQGDHLPQGPGGELAGLSEVLVPLPHLGARAARPALRRRLAGVRPRPAERRPAAVQGHQGLRRPAEGRQGQDRLLRRAHHRDGAIGGIAVRAWRPWSTASSAAPWASWWARRSRARSSARSGQRLPLARRLLLGRRPHDGGHALPHADGQDLGRARAPARGAPPVPQPPDRPHHRRRDRLLRDARRPEHRRARRPHRLRGPARDRADHPPEAARGLPARRVPAGARHGGHGGRPARAEEDDRRCLRLLG